MNEHDLSAASAYVSDFFKWSQEMNYKEDPMIFVMDRFNRCSQDKKEELYDIFNKLSKVHFIDDSNNTDVQESIIELIQVINNNN